MKGTINITVVALGLASLLAAGCAAEAPTDVAPTTPIAVADDKGAADRVANKADQWGSADDPSIFANDLVYELTALPSDGEAATIPWASSYWPVYQDSINNRWDGDDSQSPAEKFGAAFNVPDAAAKVSQHHGIAKYDARTRCTKNDDCDDTTAETCAKKPGQDEGRCIPTWWGICHAWAPASIMEAEPVHEVEENGVTFKVNDIKALVSLVYNRPSSRFVSLRCNENDSADEIEYDGYDRPTGSDSECRDTNPGTYHVLLTNYLGLRGQSFVEDRTFDAQVWNQPLRAYRITQQREVSAQDANLLVGVTAPEGQGSTTVAFAGTADNHAWVHADAVAVAAGQTLKVEMTGTADADLYVSFGQQSTLERYACRPWDAGSTEQCEVTVPDGATQAFVSVYGYEGPADFDAEIRVADSANAGVPTDYVFNDEAAKFFHVKLEVDYIAESPSTQDGNLADRIDRYTHTDRYEYVLEVDKDGKVFGGEWIGSSKKNHPDFLWLPTGRYETTVAGGAISYARVKSLLDRSIAGPNGGGGDESVTVNESGSVARGAWSHYGPYAGVTGGFNATLTGTGDADLYVRRGAQPTSASYDCRPYTSGSDESCDGAGAGEYWVSVYGYRDSDFALVVRYQAGEGDGGGDPVDPPAEVTHIDESGELAQGALAYYTVDVVAGQAIVVRTEAPRDVDLYIKMNMAPTTAVYDQRGYTGSGNETLTLTPTANGTLHIGVHGYQASPYRVFTAAP